MIFVFLFLTYFTLCDSLQVHPEGISDVTIHPKGIIL